MTATAKPPIPPVVRDRIARIVIEHDGPVYAIDAHVFRDEDWEFSVEVVGGYRNVEPIDRRRKAFYEAYKRDIIIGPDGSIVDDDTSWGYAGQGTIEGHPTITEAERDAERAERVARTMRGTP